jgi:hypothetical protein
MARGQAIAYKAGSRPAGEPSGGFREVTPERHAVMRERNITRVNPTPVAVPVPTQPVCAATTKAGTPCKATPMTDQSVCVFHS